MAETGSVHATRFEAAVKVIQSLPKNGTCGLGGGGGEGRWPSRPADTCEVDGARRARGGEAPLEPVAVFFGARGSRAGAVAQSAPPSGSDQGRSSRSRSGMGACQQAAAG